MIERVGRTNVVVDDVLVERVKQRYGIRTTREAIDFALRQVAADGDPYAIALSLEGTGWGGDFTALRGHEPDE
jgi:Arc/MetJ family transcription regulator